MSTGRAIVTGRPRLQRVVSHPEDGAAARGTISPVRALASLHVDSPPPEPPCALFSVLFCSCLVYGPLLQFPVWASILSIRLWRALCPVTGPAAPITDLCPSSGNIESILVQVCAFLSSSGARVESACAGESDGGGKAEVTHDSARRAYENLKAFHDKRGWSSAGR